MKLTILIFIGVATLQLSALAQQADPNSNKNNQTEQQDAQPKQDAATEHNDAGGTQQNTKQNSDQSSPTNQGNPVPRGESPILDGTNAIPIDSSKRPSHHGDRTRKKSKGN
jgi:hypothetical protein